MNPNKRNVRLKELKLRNFKGLRSQTLELDGKSANVFGANGSGKTTLYDAFIWALIGKDSQGNATEHFDIKTLDVVGETINNLEHEAQAVLFVEGTAVSFQKTLTQSWRTTKGDRNPTYRGDDTKYFLRGAPKKMGEYDTAVESLVASSEVIRLLSDVHYFSEKLNWKERRSILFAIVGEIDVQEIIEGNPSLDGYLEILGELTHEEMKDILSSERTRLAKELSQIPARIDEVRRSIVEIPTKDLVSAREANEKLTADLTNIQEKIAEVKAGGISSELRSEILDQRNALREAKMTHGENQTRELSELNDAVSTARRDKQKKISDFDQETSLTRSETADLHAKFSRVKNKLNIAKNEVEITERAILDEKAKVPNEDTGPDTCPACDRPMLDAKDNYAEYLETFNLNRAKRLRELNEELVTYQSTVEVLQPELENLAKQGAELEELTEQRANERTDLVVECDTAIGTAVLEYEEALNKCPVFEDGEQFKLITNQIETLNKRLDNVLEEKASAIEALNREKLEISEALDATVAVLNREVENDKNRKREEELQAIHRSYADKKEQAEISLGVLEDFITTQAGYVTNKVNAMFDGVEFQLFVDQKNGGVRETCQVLGLNGVNYSRGMNNAQKVQVGLEIIRVLSNHFGVSLPVFIDNRESVTNLPIKAVEDLQVISLIVDDDFRKLHVDVLEEPEFAEVMA